MNVSNTSKLFTLKQRGPLKTVFPSSRLFISLKQPSISSQGCFALKTETKCAYGEGNVSLPLDLQQGHTIQSSLSQDINQKNYSRVFLLLFDLVFLLGIIFNSTDEKLAILVCFTNKLLLFLLGEIKT